MQVKNSSDNPIAVGSTVIPIGATVDVKDWEDHKDRFAIKVMVKGGALVPGSDEKVEAAPDTKVTIMQELDRMKVDYDKRKGVAELKAILDEAKAKAAADGKGAGDAS